MLRFLRESVGFNDAQRYVSTLTLVTSALAIFIARPSPEHLLRKPERWRDHRVFIDTQAFRNKPFMFLTAAICFLFFGFYAVFFNLEEWAASTGLGVREPISGNAEPVEAQAGALHTYYLLSIMNATSTLGRISSAYLCDHFGALNVHAVVTFIASLLVLTLWTTAKTVPAVFAFVVLFGIFSGAVIGLPPASVAYILGLNPEAQSRLGQWVGMMYSSAAIFALTGPVIAGHLISVYDNNFITVQCWSGACMFMSAVCMAIAIYFKRRHAYDSPSMTPDKRPSSPVMSNTPVTSASDSPMSTKATRAEKEMV
jgi:MCP family monocarboxylic acid transporter-like MFS transporter 10